MFKRVLLVHDRIGWRLRTSCPTGLNWLYLFSAARYVGAWGHPVQLVWTGSTCSRQDWLALEDIPSDWNVHAPLENRVVLANDKPLGDAYHYSFCKVTHNPTHRSLGLSRPSPPHSSWGWTHAIMWLFWLLWDQRIQLPLFLTLLHPSPLPFLISFSQKVKFSENAVSFFSPSHFPLPLVPPQPAPSE